MDRKLAFLIIKQELFPLKSVFSVLALSTLFILFSFVIINYKSYASFVFASYPFFAKLKIISLIFIGTFYATSPIDIVFLTVMAVLFGINMTMVINKFSLLKRKGNLRIMFGTGIVSIAAAGCASCGLSFASLIGISAALTILPFGGVELYIIAIILLLISFYFNLKQLIKVCKVK